MNTLRTVVSKTRRNKNKVRNVRITERCETQVVKISPGKDE